MAIRTEKELEVETVPPEETESLTGTDRFIIGAGMLISAAVVYDTYRKMRKDT